MNEGEMAWNKAGLTYGATGCEWHIVVNEISLEQQSMMRGTFAYLLYVLRPTVHQKSFVFGVLIWWAPLGGGGVWL